MEIFKDIRRKVLPSVIKSGMAMVVAACSVVETTPQPTNVSVTATKPVISLITPEFTATAIPTATKLSPTEVPTAVPTEISTQAPKPGETPPEKQEVFDGTVRVWLNPDPDENLYNLFTPKENLSEIITDNLLYGLIKGGIFSSKEAAIKYLRENDGYLPEWVRLPFPDNRYAGADVTYAAIWKIPRYKINLNMGIELRNGGDNGIWEGEGNGLIRDFRSSAWAMAVEVAPDGHLVLISHDYVIDRAFLKENLTSSNSYFAKLMIRDESATFAGIARIFQYYGDINPPRWISDYFLNPSFGVKYIMFDIDPEAVDALIH